MNDNEECKAPKPMNSTEIEELFEEIIQLAEQEQAGKVSRTGGPSEESEKRKGSLDKEEQKCSDHDQKVKDESE